MSVRDAIFAAKQAAEECKSPEARKLAEAIIQLCEAVEEIDRTARRAEEAAKKNRRD